MVSTVTPSKRVSANRQNGRRGGLATALKYGPEFCQARAQKAGLTVRSKFGSQFFSHIRKFKKKGRRAVRKPAPPISSVSTIPVQTTQPNVETLKAALSV